MAPNPYLKIFLNIDQLARVADTRDVLQTVE
jgi:hypothetical protein